MSYSNKEQNDYYPSFKTFSNMSKIPEVNNPLRKNAEVDIERRKRIAFNLRKAVKKERHGIISLNKL